MTQQQWGGATPHTRRSPYGNQPAPGWHAQGFGQPGYAGQPHGAVPVRGGQIPGAGPSGFQPPSGGVPYYGQPPPRPRRNPLKSLLLGLIMLCLLAIIGLVLVNVLSTPAVAAYQNNDFQVPPPDLAPPPIPVPRTYTEAESWLVDNPLYAQTAPIPVRCDNQPINVADASDRTLERHFNAQVGCLMRVWNPPVTAAGFLLPRPSVTIYGQAITTKCGDAEVNAFYCTADQQIYFSNLLPRAVPIVKTNRWAADVVLSHEFGHAIQGRTGMLVSGHALAQDAENERSANQLLRRLETQADCFAGISVNSLSRSLGIQQSDLRGIQDTFVAVGDDSVTGKPGIEGSHGLAATREFWGTVGLSTSDIGRCNTFTAPAVQVR